MGTHDVNIVSSGPYNDYDAIPRASVMGSRGAEGKAVKALVKEMGHMEFDPKAFAGIFVETQSHAMQNRMMETMLAMIKVWCDYWDTDLMDPTKDGHYNTMAKAAYIRDMLQVKGDWND